MSTPEPLDEFSAAPAETRGGDHFADISVPDFTPGIIDADDLACDCGGDHGGAE